MLGKLFKHEFLSITRVAIPTYIAVLVISVIGRFLTWITSRQYVIDNVPATFVKIIKVLSSLISGIYIIAFIAVIILTLFYLIYRFYKNFYTDEGYLMLTLPTRPSALIASKLFNAWIWIIFSAIIAVLSLYITLGHYDKVMDLLKQLWETIGQVIDAEGDFLREELGVPLWLFGVEIFFCIFMFATRFMVTWYSSVSFGMLISKKHKALGTIFAYIIIDIATKIIMSIYVTVITKIIPDYYTILTTSGGKALQIVVLGSIAINLIFTAALFWFNSFIMTHKLNLD